MRLIESKELHVFRWGYRGVGWALKSILVTAVMLAGCSIREMPAPIVTLDWPPPAYVLWAPTGDRIAITAISGSQNASSIYVLDLKTRVMRLLVDQPYGNAVAQSWSPDGKRLAFSVNSSKNLKAGIWVINTDGSAEPEFYSEGFGMAWSSSGDVVIYRKDLRQQQVSLYLEEQARDGQKPIFSSRGVGVQNLSWSADGSKLLFLFMRENRASAVYIYDKRSNTFSRVTGEGLIESPSWSPDGRMIAYIAGIRTETVPHYSLHIACADGASTIVVPTLREMFSPAWSPQGEQFAYVGTLNNGIYLLDLKSAFGIEDIGYLLKCTAD
jgi:Tol biopolymer transport system component